MIPDVKASILLALQTMAFHLKITLQNLWLDRLNVIIVSLISIC